MPNDAIGEVMQERNVIVDAWAPFFGWHDSDEPHEFRKDRIVHQYRLSTGGWSGNESIIRAMEQNRSMWYLNWVQSRRGGHYIFEIYNVSDG